MEAFLASEGARFADDVVFSNETDGGIVASRFSSRLRRLDSSIDEVDAMSTLRGDVNAALADRPSLTSGAIFPFNFAFLFYEQVSLPRLLNRRANSVVLVCCD